MISSSFDSSSETNENQPAATPPRVPRLVSLEHRLKRAKDADGRPIPLIDELLFFLDDPPPGTGDRWQKGADLCESHGIKTSRMAVWRFYRAHIIKWRFDQIPVPEETPPSPEATASLRDVSTHRAALRTLEFLNDPALTPGHLIGLLQADNQRRKIELARDQFNDKVKTRDHLLKREFFRDIDKSAREKAEYEYNMKIYPDIFRLMFEALENEDDEHEEDDD